MAAKKPAAEPEKARSKKKRPRSRSADNPPPARGGVIGSFKFEDGRTGVLRPFGRASASGVYEVTSITLPNALAFINTKDAEGKALAHWVQKPVGDLPADAR